MAHDPNPRITRILLVAKPLEVSTLHDLESGLNLYKSFNDDFCGQQLLIGGILLMLCWKDLPFTVIALVK